MRSTWLSSVSAVVGLTLMSVVPTTAAEVPISGRKLIAKSEPAAAKRRFLFKTTRDAAVNPGVDLAAAGATLHVAGISCDGVSGICSPDFLSSEIFLQPDYWKALGNPPGSKGYRYRDKSASASGVALAVYKPGKLVIKAVGPNWPWAPAGGHDGVVVYFNEVGGDTMCADLGLGTELRNQPGNVSFRNAPAPTACQFTCGNQIREPWEDCDNDDPGFICNADCSVCCVGAACDLTPCCDPGRPCDVCQEIGAHCEYTALWQIECCDGLVCAPNQLESHGLGGDCCLPGGSECSTDGDCCGGADAILACVDSQCCVKTGEICQAGSLFDASPCCSASDVCTPTDEFPEQARWCCTDSGGACASGDTCCSGVCTTNACE